MREDKLGRDGGEQMKGEEKGRGMKRELRQRTHKRTYGLCTSGPS